MLSRTVREVGGLGSSSSFGILGSWTMIFRDIGNPIGEKSHSTGY